MAAEAQTLYRSEHFSVESDRVREGASEARAISATEMESNYPGLPDRHWKLGTDLSGYPQLHSDHLLVDALYNLSLEELRKDIRADGAFMAGAKWEGVWTRDISYSILLSLAVIEPEVAKTSLMRKVARDRIIQDTGSGGSWPVSTDRMTWALAAWEIYQVTGDRAWLAQAFPIIRNSAADDEQVIFSKRNGLVYGESSFLDWREQTYPKWMSPVDIYSSHALGTNAVHYRTYRILGQMARLLGQPADPFDGTADRIRDAVNRRLWLEQNGYYGQFLYGRNALSISPRSEALGEALSILFDLAPEKRQDRILQSVPVMEYGVPCVYPQSSGIPPYHNNAVWPFVQAFWNLAAAKRHDGAALVWGMASIYRAASLFLTNQENFVADAGTAKGTQINSERQLWSVAANLAMTYRVLLGMSFEAEGLRLSPVIPKEFGGVTTLENFHYRGAVLSLRVEGSGTSIASATMDGQALTPALIPPATEGRHEIRVVMANDDPPRGVLHIAEASVAPESPVVEQDAAILHWAAVPGAVSYVMVRNGERIKEDTGTSFTLPVAESYAEYQVSAVDRHGVHSFLSEPLVVAEHGRELTVKPESGVAPAEMSRTSNRQLLFRVKVEREGTYSIDARYANGSGPINTDNKCAIRTLSIDGKVTGAIVFPQRGQDQWSNWGYSSRQQVNLSAGEHELKLSFEPADENMNGDVNRALLEHLRLTRIYSLDRPLK